MSARLLFTCVLSVITATGYSINCIICGSSEEPSCNGMSATCSSSKHVCMSVYQASKASTAGSQEKFTFTRGCEKRSICGKSGTVTTNDVMYRLSTTCCDSDQCTPPAPTLPPISSSENGMSCPSCSSLNSLDCISSGAKVKCTKDEDYCFLESSQKTDGIHTTNIAVRGCASKGYCDLGTRYTELGSIKEKVEVTCSRSDMKIFSVLTLLGFATVSLMYGIF
ncbi:phospholipase A2 inhibitor and Ly6/PLAUR domain-containing protein-like [Pseudophryne corroboree]|uniref:phospholipase A2 inhibitor and Ly6/PLAUR domain-containing protein-like n=1 Tax=Pseudophryne corroboree TaxID=495146 RepID=UPI00308204F2